MFNYPIMFMLGAEQYHFSIFLCFNGYQAYDFRIDLCQHSKKEWLNKNKNGNTDINICHNVVFSRDWKICIWIIPV